MSRINGIEDPMDGLMNISDASSMMRHPIPPNCPPYVKRVIELNNDRVDDWEEKVLKILAVNGKFQSSKIWTSLQLYLDYFDIVGFMEKRQYFPRITKEMVDYWIDVIEKSSIRDMYALGKNTLSY